MTLPSPQSGRIPKRTPSRGGSRSRFNKLLTETGASRHIVQLYESDAFLCDSVAHYLGAGLSAGEPLVSIATAEHSAAIAARLAEQGLDVKALADQGRFVAADARATLDKFMTGMQIDRARFRAVIGGLFEGIGVARGQGCIRVYGEMVELLWQEGNRSGAIRLEELWNELAASHPFSLLCAYVMKDFADSADEAQFALVCGAHSHVIPAESLSGLEEAGDRLREIATLQQRALALEQEIARRSELETCLRDALVLERAARDEAERTVRYNELFGGILDHDLRNPLKAITAAANSIARASTEPETIKATKRILDSGERLGRLVAQLFDFTRIRLGDGLPLELRVADLGDICRRVQMELEATNPAATIQIRSTGRTVGTWDPDRLTQTLLSLVGNAVHHGLPGHPVTLACDGSDADSVTLTMHNLDLVPTAELPARFEPIITSDEQTHPRGLGLRLYITDQIVRAHGGSITAQSTEPGGTMFLVTLPRVTTTT